MRIATFNLESFGDDTFDAVALAPRIALLRPALERLDADVLCLQEINGQKQTSKGPRAFAALDALIDQTAYADFHRASGVVNGADVADRHNLVVLSRYPIGDVRTIRHDYITPPTWHPRTASPDDVSTDEISFDRPVLGVTLDLPDGRPLHVFTVHLRAPIAAPVAGQKLSATRWKSVAGWAEGYYLASMKRVGQALELRQAIDAIYDDDPDARIVAAGDFNAVNVESALRIVVADTDDTGNDELAMRVMTQVETRIPAEQRYTVLHHGRPNMLDHILVSHALISALKNVEIFNEGLADEMDDADTDAELGSFHAPLVAEFAL